MRGRKKEGRIAVKAYILPNAARDLRDLGKLRGSIGKGIEWLLDKTLPHKRNKGAK